MQRVILLINDSQDTLRAWERECGGLIHNEPDIRLKLCSGPDEADQFLSDLRERPDDRRLAAIITDGSMSANPLRGVARRLNPTWSEGYQFTKEIRGGAYGHENAHVPVAIVSGGTLPSRSSLSPPPVMLGRLQESTLDKLLRGDIILEAYNAKQLRDIHMETLLSILDTANETSKPGWLAQFWAWLRRKSPPMQDKCDSANSQRIAYQQWLDTAPPLQADEFVREKIDFIRYSFNNAIPYQHGARAWPAHEQMERLREALQSYDRHSLYIANDSLNNRLLMAVGEIRNCVDTYFNEPSRGRGR